MALGGLDVGNSGCKFVAFREDGQVIFQARADYAEKGTAGQREIDPEEVWAAVLALLRRASRECSEPIDAFAIATLGECGVPVDASGKALMRCMVTGDCRGIEESREIIGKFGREPLMEITGLPPSEMYSMPKFTWIARHTDILPKMKYMFLMEDFIAYRLTGNRRVSHSSAARTMLFNVETGNWEEPLLEYAGLRPEQMSPPGQTGEIVGQLLGSVCRETGLSPKTMVVVGGHDQNMATFGAGMLDASILEDGIGTAEVLSVMLDGPRKDAFMVQNDFACIPYILPGKYLTYLILPTCGVLTNWCRDTFFGREALECSQRGENLFDFLDAHLPEALSDILVLPQFGSSGTPHIDYAAAGVISGLTIHSTSYEIYRAVRESCIFQMKMALDILCPGRSGRIRATGGGAKSDAALQMRADIYGMSVERLRILHAGTLGCMMAAGMATGAYRDAADAVAQAVHVERTFAPGSSPQYGEKYEKFKRLYRAMHTFK